jgi:eukaryotic-like serine/threonine-protein kinase
VALARLQREPLRPRQVRPSVPRSLEDIVCRAMAREPADRYDSAADLRAALLAAGASPTADVEAEVGATNLVAAPTIPPPPQPGGRPATVPPPPTGPSFRQTERGWLVPTVILVVIALALGVAGLLFGRSGAGDFIGGVRDAIAGTEDPVQIELTNAQDFDPPPGDGAESPSQVGFAIDSDPETAWTTESYRNRDITALKPGVGLVLSAEQRGQLDKLVVTSPTNDWSASFYVADSDPGTFEGWGDPVQTLDGIEAGNAVEVDLGGAEGGAVLVWITDQGDGSGGNEVTIQEVVLFGRPE